MAKVANRKMPTPSWTRRELCGALGISIATYKRLQAEGKGPQELRLSPRIIRITPAAVEQWMMRARTAENSADANAA
ncbi:helix-turn-helix transcriptional regulator [Bradyrhizobium sp. McL0615]|uniref:helix-turn-helix transcriptional regulator n=1 Tax=Bradyrhizobium sp. McL0615 TaxID=3415673 RepID=UPI003CF0BF99